MGPTNNFLVKAPSILGLFPFLFQLGSAAKLPTACGANSPLLAPLSKPQPAKPLTDPISASPPGEAPGSGKSAGADPSFLRFIYEKKLKFQFFMVRSADPVYKTGPLANQVVGEGLGPLGSRSWPEAQTG